mmetsp:Transcript_88296/g.201884  ORF Transcript_88296/g.201884 Transcript_88296/m.201884 type:complete len:231 (+) Transcript_88296:29-721(+)
MRVVALVFAAGSADTCHDQTGCGECVNRTVVGVHACYWCEIDQGCHAVGSAVSPCTPGGADDACISLASASKCGHKSADACDAAGSDASKPRQIHLSLGGSGGMRVTWKTRAKVSTVSVMYAEDMSTAVGELATIERSVEYLKSQGGHGYHHVALMSNLRQDTTYQYRIVCDGVTSRVGAAVGLPVHSDFVFVRFASFVRSHRIMRPRVSWLWATWGTALLAKLSLPEVG